MSSYGGFAELANAIRGAPSEEVIISFKAIADVVIMAHQMKNDSPDMETADRLLRKIKRQIMAWQRKQFWASVAGTQRLRPHLLSRLHADNTLNLIYTNLDKIVGDPQEILFSQGGKEVTVAEHWLVKCIIHPDSDTEGELCFLWLSYLMKQPDYEPAEEPEERYKRQVQRIDGEGSFTSFPGLVEALHGFISAEEFDDVGVDMVLQEYLSLGATAASIWTHMWQVHGIQRGEQLAEDDYHVKIAINRIEDAFAARINDWQDKMPLGVRQKLAQHSFSGDFLFLMYHVFPNVIAPIGSDIREDMFGWKMYQYIVNAATSPEIDPTGCIALLIQELPWFPEPSDEPRLFYQPHLIEVFIAFVNPNVELRDVELEAYGPCIDIDDITKPLEQGLPANAMCTICQECFDSKVDGQSPFVQLVACEHLFHCDCLEIWVNGMHADDVLCPNCRAKICEARARRPIQD